MFRNCFGAKKRWVLLFSVRKDDVNAVQSLQKILVQERYEETSGNILLTLRSVTQKPLQYFLDNKDFTKVE